jgi:hypothetical protein
MHLENTVFLGETIVSDGEWKLHIHPKIGSLSMAEIHRVIYLDLKA